MMTSPVAVKNATGLPAQCAVAQAATVNISDHEFFLDGSHALDDLSVPGRSARTVAGFLLFDAVRARAMCLSILCCVAGRPHRFNAACTRQFRNHGTRRNFISEPPFSW
jgi:hypothetical protein